MEQYYALAADMWKEILTHNGILDDLSGHKEFVDAILTRANWQFETQLKKVLGYPTD